MFSWLKNLFKRKKVTIDSLVAGCKGNLASLSWEIGKAVLYRKDKEGDKDYDKPQVYLDRGYADCSGYARIWAECLWKLGYKAHIYSCKGGGQNVPSHAIVVFLRKGFYCYTSNDDYFSTNITERQALLEFAYPAERYEIVC
jgi:hypothetical protein